MDVQVENDGPLRRVTISGPLDIYAAREFRDSLLDALRNASQVELRLGDVTDLDTACLQVMVAAKREAASQNKTLRFANHSKTVLATLELCRLVPQFGDPVVLTGHGDTGGGEVRGA